MRYPRFATRLFDTPLAVHPGKMDAILVGIGDRFELNVPALELESMFMRPEDALNPHAAFSERGEHRRRFQLTDQGVAVVDVSGSLVRRQGDAWSGMMSYERILETVEDAATDPGVKGILLSIDSPGGEVSGLFDLVNALVELRQMKPLWAVANDYAFSAAYDIATAAERLYVAETGGVGSVGVIAVHLDQSPAEKKAGLNYTVFRAGKYKAEHNPHEPLTQHASQSLQTELDRIHLLFAEAVAERRGLNIEQVLATEAQTYFGFDGVDIGFADRVGSFDEALADLTAHVQESSGTVLLKTEVDVDINSEQPDTTPLKAGDRLTVGALADTIAEKIATPPRGSAAHPPSDEEEPMSETTPTPAEKTHADVAQVDFENATVQGALVERERQRKIRGLCQMARLSLEQTEAMANSTLSVEAVAEQLLEQRAEQDEAQQITAIHEHAQPTPAIDLEAVAQDSFDRYRAVAQT